MSNFSHLLSKHGILSSFNIARKIKTDELNKMKDKIPNKNISDTEFFKKLHTMITLQEDHHSLDEIPGLITTQNKSDMMLFFENLPSTAKLSIIDMSNKFSAYASSKKLSTLQILIAMQLIFNQLGISTEDLKKFNDKFRPPNPDDEDESDDDEDDNEY